MVLTLRCMDRLACEVELELRDNRLDFSEMGSNTAELGWTSAAVAATVGVSPASEAKLVLWFCTQKCPNLSRWQVARC